MEAKKHPALLATLVVLGLTAVAGLVLTSLQATKFASTQKALKSAEGDVERLLTKEPVALTQENVEAAKKTLEKFRAAEAEHRAELAGGNAVRFDADFKGEPGELGSEIKEFVERWHTKLKAENVPIVRPAASRNEAAFGFSRYYQTGVNPTKSLPVVYRQTKVIDFLLRTLMESKLKDEVRFLGIQREPLELVGVNAVSFNRDEISPVHDAVLKQEGLLRSETFRLQFIARTDVVRRFVNAVTDAHRPICVRGVEITIPTKEQMTLPVAPDAAKPADAALPASFFADAAPVAPATPADGAKPAEPAVVKPEVVVESAPSVVTVTFAYIEVIKPEAPASSNP